MTSRSRIVLVALTGTAVLLASSSIALGLHEPKVRALIATEGASPWEAKQLLEPREEIQLRTPSEHARELQRAMEAGGALEFSSVLYLGRPVDLATGTTNTKTCSGQYQNHTLLGPPNPDYDPTANAVAGATDEAERLDLPTLSATGREAALDAAETPPSVLRAERKPIGYAQTNQGRTTYQVLPDGIVTEGGSLSPVPILFSLFAPNFCTMFSDLEHAAGAPLEDTGAGVDGGRRYTLLLEATPERGKRLSELSTAELMRDLSEEGLALTRGSAQFEANFGAFSEDFGDVLVTIETDAKGVPSRMNLVADGDGETTGALGTVRWTQAATPLTLKQQDVTPRDVAGDLGLTELP